MKTATLSRWLLTLGILSFSLSVAQAQEPTEPEPAVEKAVEPATETPSTEEASETKSQEPEPVEQAQTEEAEGLDIFQAIDDGLVEVKFVARDDSKGRLVLTNKTDQPVAIQIPDAFAGVPVAKQFGGGGGGGGFGGGGGGGSQSVGGGGGGGGRGGGGGGRFNIAPEKVERIDVPLLCLDHGLKDPSSSKPYEIRPIEDVVESPAVVEIVKSFAKGELPRSSCQAAVWHIHSDVSWIDLANKLTGTERQFVREPYFSGPEVRLAMAIVHQAELMTKGVTLEKRNWKSPSQEDFSDEIVIEDHTPEMTVPDLDEDSQAETEAESSDAPSDSQ